MYAFGGLAGGQAPAAAARRQVSIGGKRIRVIDVHAHCVIPEVAEVVKATPFAKAAAGGGNNILGPARLATMDGQGVDIQALSINGYWWYDGRPRARDGDRQDAERGAGQVGVRAPGSLRGDDVRGAAVPRPGGPTARGRRQAARAARRDDRRARERRGLSGAEVRPVLGEGRRARRDRVHAPQRVGEHHQAGRAAAAEATWATSSATRSRPPYFLSRLIFDGTLDRHPGLRVCGAHAGGYLPSYLGRTDVACDVRANANCANKKRPRDYFKRELLVDTMVFSEEGLAPPGGGGGRQPGGLRHRRAVQLAGDGGSGSQRVVSEQRGQGSDPRVGT